MSRKLKYTFDDYYNNPSGKGSAVAPGINKKYLYQNYEESLLSLESRKGKIQYECFSVDVKNKIYYIIFRIPSNSVEGVFNDVVVEFSSKESSILQENSIKNYYVRFFANDESFVFTYAYAYKTHGILITELENKLPLASTTQKAAMRNPDNTVGYCKNIVFAYLIMKRDNLFDKSILNRLCKNSNITFISNKMILSWDKKTKQKSLYKKGIKENDTHSKMIKSKNLEKNIPSTSHSTKMTKTVGVIKGGSKFIKKTKRK